MSAREEKRKPFLLHKGMYVSLVFGSSLVLAVVLAPFDVMYYSINDQQTTGAEFVRQGGWALGLAGVALLANAWGLWTDRWWTREVMLLFWFLLAAIVLGLKISQGPARAHVITEVLLPLGVPAAIAWWYLYLKPNVRAYYRVIDAAQHSPPWQ